MNALLDVDVVLNTSLSEGLAAVILEAWSAGKVIVARRNSGNCAVIKEGVSGVLFDTPEECIAIVDRLLTADAYKHKMETLSREYIALQSLFDKEKRLLESVMKLDCSVWCNKQRKQS